MKLAFVVTEAGCLDPTTGASQHIAMGMRELAVKVLAETGSESSLIYQPLPADDPRQRRPNIDQSRNLLDWEPKLELNEGLEPTVEYFRTLVGRELS